MLASRGFGQVDPFAGLTDTSTSGVWDPGWLTGGGFPTEGTPPFVDTSGTGVNTPGTTMGGSGASGVLSVLNTVIQDGAAVAKVALTPTARIAGPYGVSSIPIGGSVTPSGLMMSSGLSLGGISPTLLLVGLGLVVVLAMAGHRS